MAKGSAFARMIGLTKSLSPLGFDRAAPEPDDAVVAAAPAVADEPTNETTVDSPAVTIAADADAFPVAPTAAAPVPTPGSGSEAGAVVVSFPAIAKVTVVGSDQGENAVAAEVEASPILPADPLRLDPLPVPDLPAADSAPVDAAADEARDVVTAEAISAIEADIASLLASLDREELAGDAAVSFDSLDDDGSDEAQVGVLLSELDRLWQADPAIPFGRGA